MELTFRRATLEDLDLLAATRAEVLKVANKFSPEADMTEVRQRSHQYYEQALADDSHVAYLVFDGDSFVGSGGISFYRVMPTCHNLSGDRAYIMNMYTAPSHRRKGIAHKTLDMLVAESKGRGVVTISLEATEMGRPLYDKYGFVSMEDEMELQARETWWSPN